LASVGSTLLSVPDERNVLLLVVDDDYAVEAFNRRDPRIEGVLPISRDADPGRIEALVAAMGGHEAIANPQKTRYRHVCVVAPEARQHPLIALVAKMAWDVIERNELFACEPPYEPLRERRVSIKEARRVLGR
jgi:hypothetical protein